MKVLVPLIAPAGAVVLSLLLMPAPADAQVRVAQPRPVPSTAVVVTPTVFIGGYYYPTIYRPGLLFGGFGYGYSPRYYGPAYYQWRPFGYYDLSGSVRLQVEPEETEVFVDGYYAGQVDEFDGVFQRLRLEPGEHHIELYLPGHRTYTQRVYLQPGRTFNIRHRMEPLGRGEAAPSRPSGAPLPPPGARAPRDPRLRPAPGTQGLPPPRLEAEAKGFGQLSLRVQPRDAEVLIDRERWETPPGTERLNVQLGGGLHHLEIRKEGYRSYFTDITIRDGQTLTLNVALTPQ